MITMEEGDGTTTTPPHSLNLYGPNNFLGQGEIAKNVYEIKSERSSTTCGISVLFSCTFVLGIFLWSCHIQRANIATGWAEIVKLDFLRNNRSRDRVACSQNLDEVSLRQRIPSCLYFSIHFIGSFLFIDVAAELTAWVGTFQFYRDQHKDCSEWPRFFWYYEQTWQFLVNSTCIHPNFISGYLCEVYLEMQLSLARFP